MTQSFAEIIEEMDKEIALLSKENSKKWDGVLSYELVDLVNQEISNDEPRKE